LRFIKKITFLVEGEIYGEDISPEDLLKSIKWHCAHWWECGNWPYGKPSEPLQGGVLKSLKLDGVELFKK
jgi:hypothetical protein